MPAPTNDNFANAQDLASATSGSLTPITIDLATTEVGEPVGSAIGTINQSIWFKWTCPAGIATVEFDTAGSPTSDPADSGADGFLDTTMAVWVGSILTALTEITSNDDAAFGTYTSKCSFVPVAGTTYYIQVGTFNPGYVGQVKLNWSVIFSPTVPSNDSCAHAIALSGLSGTISGDNTLWGGAWPTGNDPLYNAYPGRGSGAPLWWKWTNPLGVPVDFQVIYHKHSKDFNGGVAVGVCGSLSMTTPVVGLDTNNEVADWDLANGEQLDIIVHPGETVFIEFDSYYVSSAFEPPIAIGSNRGDFSFSWGAASVVFRDGITPQSVLVADLSSGRTTAMSGFGGEVWDSTVFNGRFYSLWKFEYNSSFPVTSEVWISSCNLDGSDLQSQMLLQLQPSTPFGSAAIPGANLADPDGPGPFGRLVTDGSKIVALVHHYLVVSNPDYTGTLPFSGDARGVETAIQYSFDIWKEGASHVWSLLNTITSSPSASFSPSMRYRICASSDQPGVAYFGCGYLRRRLVRDDSTVFSDVIEDRFTRYSINLTTGAVTLLLDESSGFVAYNNNVWTINTPVSTYFWDVVDDTTHPTMVRVKRTVSDASLGDTYDSVVSVERFDTGALIRTINFIDILPAGLFSYAGLAPNTQHNQGNLTLRIFPKLTIGGQSKRLISWDWGGTSTAGKWLHIINSDFSGTIDQLENSVLASSRYTGSFSNVPRLPFYDTARNVWIPSGNSTLAQYDMHCSHALDFYTIGFDLGQQYGGWDSTSFYATDTSQFGTIFSFRKIGPILRDHYICTVGSFITVSPSIFWFYRDGQWRQQNTDTTHSLYFYKDGQWRTPTDASFTLKGRLASSWQQ